MRAVCCRPGLATVRPWLQGKWPCTEFMKAHKPREVWSRNLTTGQHIRVKLISEPRVIDWTESDMLSLHLTNCKACRWPSIYSQLVIGLLSFTMCCWCFGFGARSCAISRVSVIGLFKVSDHCQNIQMGTSLTFQNSLFFMSGNSWDLSRS